MTGSSTHHSCVVKTKTVYSEVNIQSERQLQDLKIVNENNIFERHFGNVIDSNGKIRNFIMKKYKMATWGIIRTKVFTTA